MSPLSPHRRSLFHSCLPAATFLTALFISRHAPCQAPDDDVLAVPEAKLEEESPAGVEAGDEYEISPLVREKIEEMVGVQVTTEEVLASTPSVRVKRFGSFGSPSFISLRGADSVHTLVLLDEVPLNEAATGFVDLSTLPVAMLDEVTVLRGSTPHAPFPFHPGGVVKLSLKRPPLGGHVEAGLRLGLFPLAPGSAVGRSASQELKDGASALRFGALRQILLSSSFFDGRLGVLASGAIEQGKGDFVYYSDNGTVYRRDDDRFLSRTNNDYTSASSLLVLTFLPDAWSELKASLLNFSRTSGVPGLDIIAACRTKLRVSRHYFSLTYKKFGEDASEPPRFGASGYFKASLLQWFDPLGEISIARGDSRSLSLGAGTSLSGRLVPARGATLLWSLSGGVERWRRGDSFATGQERGQATMRLNTGGSVTQRVAVAGGLLGILASFKMDLYRDLALDSWGEGMPWDEPGGREERTEMGRAQLFISPGAEIRLAPYSWLVLTLSVSYSHRPPTLIELFGNQGTIVGNAELMPERGVAADFGVGFVLSRLLPSFTWLNKLEVGYHFFDNRIADLITFIQNSQKTMVAQNIGRAQIGGVELIVTAKMFSMIELRFGYTFLDPRDRSGLPPYDGRMLPNRPRHDLFLRVSFNRWNMALAYELDFLSGGFVDRAGQRPLMPRAIHSLAAQWAPVVLRGFYAALEVWNLANEITIEREVYVGGRRYALKEAISDVDGYPLPGLGIYFSLGFRQ